MDQITYQSLILEKVKELEESVEEVIKENFTDKPATDLERLCISVGVLFATVAEIKVILENVEL
jgi:hypothetical protein